MAISYDRQSTKIDLFSVLEEHAEWFNKLSLHLFYPHDVREDQSLVRPTSFAQWINNNHENQSVIQPEMIEKLSNLHSELFQMAQGLQNHVQRTQSKPSYKDFHSFVTMYEEFAINIRRLEREILLDGNGFDALTGLRNAKLVEKDVTRELDRLARQGRNFCLALVRVDHFNKVQASVSDNEMTGYIRLLADLIKLSLRSFDDAYYLDNGEYLLCLKQSEISGGISALERLRKELERQAIKVTIGTDPDVAMSMSCVIGEPVAGDKADELIGNLREDLHSKNQIKTDTVLQYHELSPLQRYVQGAGDTAN
ncbi:MAG: diguanylate cyclase domain-containing protein [Alphaproteobacteria bacterium]